MRGFRGRFRLFHPGIIGWLVPITKLINEEGPLICLMRERECREIKTGCQPSFGEVQPPALGLVTVQTKENFVPSFDPIRDSIVVPSGETAIGDAAGQRGLHFIGA